MSSDNIHGSNAIMILEIVESILKSSDNPVLAGEIFADSLRSLTGAKITAIFISEGEHKLKPITIIPKRRESFFYQKPVEEFIEASFSLDIVTEISYMSINKIHGLSDIIRVNELDNSIIAPLKVGNTNLGSLMLLGLPDDKFGMARLVNVIEMLTGVLTLIINNSKLFLEQEKIIDLRTKKLQKEIENRKKIELELADYQAHLEEEVEDRTRELRKYVDELTHTQRRLIDSEKMASLGNLVAGIAHEVNTPLGICITAASFLESEMKNFVQIYHNNGLSKSIFEKITSDLQKSTKILVGNLSRATELMGSFKQLAVDQSNDELREFDLKEYIMDILLSVEASFVSDSFKIEFNCPDKLKIVNYPGAMYQILMNLLQNSIIHGFSEKNEGKITLDVKLNENTVYLTYNDNGAGINSSNISKIFEPFFTTRRNKGGSGLGLNIVYNIVTQKLNGNILCESIEGEFTKFYIDFPRNI